MHCVTRDPLCCSLPDKNLVGLQPKLLSTILWFKDKPKIKNLKKIQDTYDVVTKNDTGDMANEANLLSTKKVRWKDKAKTIMATEMKNELIIVDAHF